MKFLLSAILTLSFSPLALSDDYVPDENHTPPDIVEAQEEREEEYLKQAQEKQGTSREDNGDPRFEEFKQKMPKDREYESHGY